jgi:hypothetical protein
MKSFFFLIVAILFSKSPLFAFKVKNISFSDSTLHERFIVNLLNDCDKDGAWLFLELDSCDNTRFFNVVEIKKFYSQVSRKFSSFDKARFVFYALSPILERNAFDNCKHEADPIKGNRINMKRYKLFLKQPIEKILTNYFNVDKTLKSQYKKWLYEIIAVCYNKNVKVVTPNNALPYYEVFK